MFVTGNVEIVVTIVIPLKVYRTEALMMKLNGKSCPPETILSNIDNTKTQIRIWLTSLIERCRKMCKKEILYRYLSRVVERADV